MLKIISEFIDADEKNYRLLQNNLYSCKAIFQYVYPNVFHEIYCSTEKRGFNLKSNFHIMSQTYKNKMQMQRYIGKNPANYKTIRKETSKNLQILTILMILKRLRLKSESNFKKKKKKGARQLKKTSCYKREKLRKLK